MRLAWALLLLVTAAHGQDLVAEVRDFIDAHRSEDSRRVLKAVVPTVPKAGADPLVVEYRIGNHAYAYTKISCVVREQEVDLVQVRVNARDPGFPLRPRAVESPKWSARSRCDRPGRQTEASRPTGRPGPCPARQSRQ